MNISGIIETDFQPEPVSGSGRDEIQTWEYFPA